MHRKGDVNKANQINNLLKEHGFALSAFGDSGVGFYKATAKWSDGTIPIHSWYFMSHKDFAVFMDVIQRLDKAEKKLDTYSEFVTRNR